MLAFHLLLVEKQVPGSYEKARLRFAHAETVLPFTCLLGLFLEGEGHGKWFFCMNKALLNLCTPFLSYLFICFYNYFIIIFYISEYNRI